MKDEHSEVNSATPGKGLIGGEIVKQEGFSRLKSRRFLLQAVIAVACVCMLPFATISIVRKSRRIERAERLKKLWFAVMTYAADHNQYPESLDQLLADGLVEKNALLDPVTGKTFVCVGSKVGTSESREPVVLAFAPDGQQNPTVGVFSDGWVGNIPPAQVLMLKRIEVK